MVLTKLETEQKEDDSKFSMKLDKTYLKLIDLYLETDQEPQRNQIILLIESRLESISTSQEYAYRLMNELANSLHQHRHFELALVYYKKALLCMKRRHKNKYLT